MTVTPKQLAAFAADAAAHGMTPQEWARLMVEAWLECFLEMVEAVEAKEREAAA